MSRSSQVLGALVLGLLLVGCSETPDPTSTTNLGSQSASPEPSSTPSPTALSAQEVTEQTFNEFTLLAADIRDVALEIEASGTTLLPLLGTRPDEPASSFSFCVCSDSQKTIDAEGITLDATFAPLAADTTSVTVLIPGFEPITDVPVTR